MPVMVFILLLWRRKERNLLAQSGKKKKRKKIKEKKPDRKSSFSPNTVSVIAFGNYCKTEAYKLLFYCFSVCFLCFLVYSFNFHALFVYEIPLLCCQNIVKAHYFHLITSVFFE